MRPSMRQAVGSLLFSCYLLVSWMPFALVVLVVGPWSYRAAYAIGDWWAASVLRLCDLLCGIRYEVHGQENIPAGNAVALWKHSSAFETLAEMRIFPRQTWVLKRELMWIPLFGWALHWLRPIAIDRGGGRNAVEQVLQQGGARLREGLWVMVFPEGTRTAPGETRRYGVSGALLAREHGVPIVPVAHDAGLYWPRRAWWKKPGTVRIVIGPAVETRGRDLRDINAQVQEWIEETMARLTGLPKAQLPEPPRWHERTAAPG